MGVLKRTQTEIEKRSLAGGGWSSGRGTKAGIETTCYALMALHDSEGRARDHGIDLLLRTQNPDGSWPAFECESVLNRIELGTEMLRDRACPQGGWNAGNGIIFGSALTPHVDTTAIALLALTEAKDVVAFHGLNWLRQACVDCSSAYSLAWSSIAFTVHRNQALNNCIARLDRALSSTGAISNIETLSLAAIAMKAANNNGNPFEVVI
jgi:hypothetical protein